MIALSALACGLALAAPSSGLAKRAGPGFKVGTYKGKTSQGLPIKLTVSRRAVTSVRFDWRARCADGQTHRNTILVSGGMIRRRSFSTRGLLNTRGRFRVRGKLRGRVAWGRLSRWGPSAFGTFDCPARGVRWKVRFSRARRTPPPATSTIFQGTTSQGLPISFAATPTSVLSLYFDWTAFCEDGRHHTNTISAGGSSIKEGAFSMGGILNTGGSFQVDGVVNGRSAAGTLSRNGPSAFGTFDCSATGVTWQARAINNRR